MSRYMLLPVSGRYGLSPLLQPSLSLFGRLGCCSSPPRGMTTERGVSGTPPPPRTPEMITMRSYICPITELDDDDIENLRVLLKIAQDLRHYTQQTRRIQRGSPGAGALGAALSSSQSEVRKIEATLQELFDSHDQFPGMYLLRLQFKELKSTLFRPFNDGGNDPGYSERVSLLEELMYVNGTLKGQLEVILEQHSYWKAKVAGEEPPRVVRHLDFDQCTAGPDLAQTFGQLANGLGAINLGLSPPSSHNANPPPVGRERDRRFGGPRRLQQSVGSPTPKPRSPPKGTISVNINLLQHLRSGIICLWESREHTDVTLIVDSTHIPAHRVILASQSEYFDRLLFGEMREAHSGAEIPLQDTPLEAFQLLMKYAYSGSLEIRTAKLQDVLEVVALADRFSFVLLKEALGEQLSRHISQSSVLELFVHADTCHLSYLREKCLKFIDNNAELVLKSDAFLLLPQDSLMCIISRDTFIVPEVSVFRAVLQWKEQNKQSVEETSDILKCVRLSEISPQELFEVVEPCSLFSEPSILKAIRVQMLPDLEQMQPRGKKDPGTNQLKYVTTVEPRQVFNYPQQWDLALGSPPQSIIEGVIQLGAVVATQANCGRLNFGHAFSGQPTTCTCTVSLDGIYLLNELQLIGYPDFKLPIQSFSYVIKVSRDKKAWLQLFNYSGFTCFATQRLHFPTQALRYIQFELTGRSDESQVFTLRFLTCHFAEDQKPFRFRANGVIAPLSPLTPQFTQSEYKRKDDLPACLVTFHQPYSISQLRLKAYHLQSTKGDVVVLVSTVKEEDSFVKLVELKNKEFGTTITVEFPERVVSYVMVVVKNPKMEAKLQPASTTPLGIASAISLQSTAGGASIPVVQSTVPATLTSTPSGTTPIFSFKKPPQQPQPASPQPQLGTPWLGAQVQQQAAQTLYAGLQVQHRRVRLRQAQPVPPQAQPMPQAQPLLPQAQPLLPQAQPLLPQAQPLLPQAQPLLPQAQPLLPQAQPLLPQEQTVPPQAQQKQAVSIKELTCQAIDTPIEHL